ncbi:hypothetical protein [Psychroflexus sp. ALD_RP9]|uniref:hypothetical protein n=1 Tax=Psychroflexus sp. ALD_RP9 TaxID=2777186 RepID=UPI001A8D0DED|nr:hypothetical protein [Psychroflexus sp. ALD_RP9]QSS96318.1 hypothetical protein IMZ30_07570 [Psychroflexus sp. ALD_RP9]QSS96325.1 hypothetical protein IMZ30_07605 [Psychroflexus sp. ALD_RP9]
MQLQRFIPPLLHQLLKRLKRNRRFKKMEIYKPRTSFLAITLINLQLFKMIATYAAIEHNKLTFVVRWQQRWAFSVGDVGNFT